MAETPKDRGARLFGNLQGTSDYKNYLDMHEAVAWEVLGKLAENGVVDSPEITYRLMEIRVLRKLKAGVFK